MAFLIHSVDDGRNVELVGKPCAAITPVIGMALAPSSGNLAIASGTTAPTYISMQKFTANLTAGDQLIVARVNHDIVWETTLSANGSSLHIGDKVTMASDGLRVTATTGSGVAEIVDFPDGVQTSGARVRVRF